MSNDMVFDALDILMGSSKSYVGADKERAFITSKLRVDERCVSVINFAVAANEFVSAINVVEYVVERLDGTQYMVGLITSDGKLVFRYVAYSDGSTDIDVDVDGDWKWELGLTARVVAESE